MKKFISLIASAAIVLAGCESGVGTDDPGGNPGIVIVTGVTLSASTLTLDVGATQTLAATVAPDNATNRNVAWKSGNPDVATVDAQGKVTAIADGTATITATTVEGRKTATCTVTVGTGGTGRPSVTIGKVEWATHNIGEAGRFTAAPEDRGNYYTFQEALTACPPGWRLPTLSEFQILTISGSEWPSRNGVSGRLFGSGDNTLFLPAAGYRDGSGAELNIELSGHYWSSLPFSDKNAYNLRFDAVSTNPADNSDLRLGMAVRCVYGVGILIPVSGVWLDKSTHIFDNIGDRVMLSATVVPSDAPNRGVTWTSSDPAIATVDDNGNVTAIGQGVATITVTTSEGGKTASCIITITTDDNPQMSVEIGGVEWATRNVGTVGQFAQSPESYGTLFQFNTAIMTCPVGWRLPIREEMLSLGEVDSEWTTRNRVPGRRFRSEGKTIFLPASGYRPAAIGGVEERDVSGYYWTSVTNGASGGFSMYFTAGNVNPHVSSYEYQISVRCVRETAPQVTDEVEIGGVRWASHNVGGRGLFVSSPEVRGGYYSFSEAQTVCPEGWRTPTAAEFQNLIDSGNRWVVHNGELGREFGTGSNTIFLPAAGYMFSSDSETEQIGSNGIYWASNLSPYDEKLGYVLSFDPPSAGVSIHTVTFRYSVRCVR